MLFSLSILFPENLLQVVFFGIFLSVHGGHCRLVVAAWTIKDSQAWHHSTYLLVESDPRQTQSLLAPVGVIHKANMLEGSIRRNTEPAKWKKVEVEQKYRPTSGSLVLPGLPSCVVTVS